MQIYLITRVSDIMENSSYVIDKLNKKQLLDIFDSFLLESNFAIENKSYESNLLNVKLNDGARKFDLYFILKNISSGGWKDNSDIKRIQVGNIKDKLVTTNKKRTHMLCGLIRYENKYILVVWNSYIYTSHNTNRSCYVYSNTIKKCYETGYVFSHEFDQEIWLCDSSKFGLLIRDYISYNYVE